MNQNIIDNFPFQSDRPGISPVQKTEKTNIFAVGLTKGQLMQKHRTPLVTLLVVLKGSLSFFIEEETIQLTAGSSYAIPPTIEHEVRGKDEENIFLLIQEK